jgi:hypothetical protein
MSGTRFFRFGGALFCLVTVGWVLAGKAAKPRPEVLITDWSHRHLIFSQPSTPRLASLLANQIRYRQQELQRHTARQVVDQTNLDQRNLDERNLRQFSLGEGSLDQQNLDRFDLARLNSDQPDIRKRIFPIIRVPKNGVRRDWAEDLGSGGSVGAGNFPAKVSFQSSTANCGDVANPDFVVFSTGILGLPAGQASIVAYDNLYSGCGGTIPSVYWAYNTLGQITTSPVISGDGTQIAFVQTNGVIVATLVLLKWKSSTTDTVTAPTTLTPVVALSDYPTCSAPCMAEIPLTDREDFSTDDTLSSVFYDYETDTAWVGDSESYLHQFKPVFKGIPSEVRDATWPLQVNPANPAALSSPVHDLVSGNIFLGDVRGQAYRVNPTNANIVISNQLDHGTGIVDSPVVDSTAQKVYVFVSDDGGTGCAGGPCAGVVQFTTGFGTGAMGVEVTVGGSGTTPEPLYDGAFDSAYQASSNATGSMYVCGNTGGAPTLYKIAINAGTMSTAVAGPTLTSAATGCSPVSDISNLNATGGPAEWVFAGVQASGSGNSCAAGGCILNFGTQPWKASTMYAVGQQVVDTHFQIQTVRVPGMSGTATPGWSTGVRGNTNDNQVSWTNQGPEVASHPTWIPLNDYLTVGTVIVDSNNNVEVVTIGGLSQAGTHPTWSTVVNGRTTDGTVTWHMVGALSTSSLAAAGGTSGIIMDNTVATGTLAGASQIYFSTLSDQTCATSGGTGGCAVQASQSALQ